ncbi:helix-turn-helix domain-containing protein [Vallitalea okinawensis]|uniref:helix-turn-helix domain-containing protein n=1 Tax=Vallitalea okinawensis TaxID=2078660 RepID=UPI000CFAD7E1|nr:AraC family transcriptional regulator [Vallitalea okinawensis]
MYFNQEWERLHGIETDYVKLYYYDFQPGYSDTYHSYSYHRICTILDGIKDVRVDDGEEFTYDQNEYVLLSPHSEVYMTMPVDTKALVLELSDDLIDDVSQKVSVELEKDISLKNYDYFHSDMSRLLANSLTSINDLLHVNEDEKEQHFFIDLAVQQLTYGLLKDKNSREFIYKDINHPMKRALEIIKEGYDQGITISEIAFNLHMSVPHFSNQFKKTFNITPKQYLNNYKMERSKEMLRKQTVSEVAFDLGYSNVSNYIDQFKKKYKITPKQYQLEHMRRLYT